MVCRAPQGAERSLELPEAIRSREMRVPRLAALSNERLAKDDSSAIGTHAGPLTVTSQNLAGLPPCHFLDQAGHYESP
jgi:hypothetical protein